MLIFSTGSLILIFIHICGYGYLLSFLICNEKEYILSHSTMHGRILCVLQTVMDEGNVEMYQVHTLSYVWTHST